MTNVLMRHFPLKKQSEKIITFSLNNIGLFFKIISSWLSFKLQKE